jgi:hypothetical protein
MMRSKVDVDTANLSFADRGGSILSRQPTWLHYAPPKEYPSWNRPAMIRSKSHTPNCDNGGWRRSGSALALIYSTKCG